jgi:hypothetical protein
VSAGVAFSVGSGAVAYWRTGVLAHLEAAMLTEQTKCTESGAACFKRGLLRLWPGARHEPYPSFVARRSSRGDSSVPTYEVPLAPALAH